MYALNWSGYFSATDMKFFRQNFFSVVKAIVSQERENFTKSDGYHHYEPPERDAVST